VWRTRAKGRAKHAVCCQIKRNNKLAIGIGVGNFMAFSSSLHERRRQQTTISVIRRREVRAGEGEISMHFKFLHSLPLYEFFNKREFKRESENERKVSCLFSGWKFVTQVIYRTLSAGPTMIVKENSNFIDFVCGGGEMNELRWWGKFLYCSHFTSCGWMAIRRERREEMKLSFRQAGQLKSDTLSHRSISAEARQ
jgi:hypothetical protein